MKETIETIQDKRTFECQVCNKRYKTKNNLKYHLKTHAADVHVCTLCTRLFKSDQSLKEHKVKYHSKSELCTVCGKFFTSKSILKTHIQTKHDPHLNKCHVCPFDGCRKTFSRVTLYQDHINIHTGVKPYQCSVCKRAYHYRYKKNQHERACSGVVQHNCIECGSVFTDVTSLKRHRESQHSNMSYQCPCGKQYAYYSCLYKHQKNKNH